jgi:hypothetical protein
MPSIKTLVADLADRNARPIIGIAQKPQATSNNKTTTISDSLFVKYRSANMIASITPGKRLSCVAAGTASVFNGIYVNYAVNWSTIGDMDSNRLIVASGNFSGCLWNIYRSAAGVFKCAHIYRSDGIGADANANLMADYAKQAGWTELQSVPSAGCIGPNGSTEVLMVSQLFPNQRIDTVRVQVNSQGLIVGSQLFTCGV